MFLFIETTVYSFNTLTCFYNIISLRHAQIIVYIILSN